MANHGERQGLAPIAALGLRSLPKLTITTLSRPCFIHIRKWGGGQILVGLSKPAKVYGH